MRNRKRFRSLAPACFPPVVPGLRIEEHRRIGQLGHGRVAPVDVAVVLALSPLPVRGQEVESVDDGHHPGRSLFVTGRGLLTATGRGVEALVHGETGLDPLIDTGLAVTGRGQLTATGHAVSVRVPLPAGEIGVTARGHTLSRVALLPARGQKIQDGWPDERSRRVLRRLPLSLLLFLKCRWQLLLLQEGLL